MIFAKSEGEIYSAPRFATTFMSSCLTKTAFLFAVLYMYCTFWGMTKLHVHVPFIGRYSHSSHLIQSQFTPDITESALLWAC